MLDQLQQPGEVAAQGAHDLFALFVLDDLARLGAMDDVPVVGSRHEHLGVAEEIVELVEGRQSS